MSVKVEVKKQYGKLIWLAEKEAENKFEISVDKGCQAVLVSHEGRIIDTINSVVNHLLDLKELIGKVSSKNIKIFGVNIAEPYEIGWGGDFDYYDKDSGIRVTLRLSGNITAKMADGDKLFKADGNKVFRLASKYNEVTKNMLGDMLRPQITDAIEQSINQIGGSIKKQTIADIKANIKDLLFKKLSDVLPDRYGINIIDASVNLNSHEGLEELWAVANNTKRVPYKQNRGQLRCVVCGSELTSAEAQFTKRCARCDKQSAIGVSIARRDYQVALILYKSPDFNKVGSDKLYEFYGVFLNYATDLKDGAKRRAFCRFLQQNTDSSSIDSDQREVINDILVRFEGDNKDKEVVDIIAEFLLKGKSSKKLTNEDKYVPFCISNAQNLGINYISTFLKSDEISFTNKKILLDNAAKLRVNTKDEFKEFLYLCKDLSADKRQSLGKDFVDIGYILTDLMSTEKAKILSDKRLRRKADKLIKKSDQKKSKSDKPMQDKSAKYLAQKRKQRAKFALVGVLVMAVIVAIATIIYGYQPTGIEVLPSNQTQYIYEDQLNIKYKANRLFAWLEGGSITTNKLEIKDYNPQQIGQQEITIKYKGFQQKLTININPKTLSQPSIAVKDGNFAISGDIATQAYDISLQQHNTNIAAAQLASYNIRGWVSTLDLSAGEYTLKVAAKGDGIRLLDSAVAGIQIHKLSSPQCSQEGNLVLFQPVSGAVSYIVTKGGADYAQTSTLSLPLDAKDFTAGETTLVAKALGTGMYIDSAPVQFSVAKAAAPTFSQDNILPSRKIDAEGSLAYYYRPQSDTAYTQNNNLKDDINLLPQQSGQYELVVREIGTSIMPSDYSQPVTITRLSSPIFSFDANANLTTNTTNYKLFYKTATQDNWTEYDCTIDSFQQDIPIGEYLVCATSLPNNKLELPSAQTDAQFTTPTLTRKIHDNTFYRFTWYSVFGDAEVAKLKLIHTSNTENLIVQKNQQYSYYTADSNNKGSYLHAQLYIVQYGSLFFAKYSYN